MPVWAGGGGVCKAPEGVARDEGPETWAGGGKTKQRRGEGEGLGARGFEHPEMVE